MHHHIGRPIPGLERLAQVEGGQLGRGQRTAQHQAPGPHPGGEDLVKHAEAAKHPGGVGCQLQARTELGELRRLLQHPNLVPVPCQGQGGGQAADPAADDQDVHVAPPCRRLPVASLIRA
jgi:hypothetical protein